MTSILCKRHMFTVFRPSIFTTRIVVVHDSVFSNLSFLIHIINMSHTPHMPPFVSVSTRRGECIMGCIRPHVWMLFMLVGQPSTRRGSTFSRIQHRIGVACSDLTTSGNRCPLVRLQGRTCGTVKSVHHPRLGQEGGKVCQQHKIRRAPKSHRKGSLKSN